jgi:regulator of sigma E protease
MNIIMQFIAFIVTILVLVSFHEAGHFGVAKLLGIKVLKFSIGFGKPLARFYDKQGTEYVLALLPLGGYVKLLDEREAPVDENEKHLAFNRQPLWARLLVVLAGPATNILFAILGFWLMFMIGTEAYRPIIGEVKANSVASQAGITSQDQIIKIDGHLTPSLQKVILAIVLRLGEKGSMVMEVNNVKTHQTSTHWLDLSQWKINPLNPDPLSSLGIEPIKPQIPAIIYEVEPDSPAAKAGLRPADKILSVNDKPINDWLQLLAYAQARPGNIIKLTYQRQQLIKTVELKIEGLVRGFKSIGYLGVRPAPVKVPPEYRFERKYGPIKALGVATHETSEFLIFNFVVLKKMLFGQLSLNSLGGPITIFQTADSALKQGFTIFLGFLSLISVMLAFVNLLPIPGLDGGHLLNYLIEFIKGSPVSVKYEIISLKIGLFLLLLLMVLATFNDLMRLFAPFKTS